MEYYHIIELVDILGLPTENVKLFSSVNGEGFKTAGKELHLAWCNDHEDKPFTPKEHVLFDDLRKRKPEKMCDCVSYGSFLTEPDRRKANFSLDSLTSFARDLQSPKELLNLDYRNPESIPKLVSKYYLLTFSFKKLKEIEPEHPWVQTLSKLNQQMLTELETNQEQLRESDNLAARTEALEILAERLNAIKKINKKAYRQTLQTASKALDQTVGEDQNYFLLKARTRFIPHLEVTSRLAVVKAWRAYVIEMKNHKNDSHTIKLGKDMPSLSVFETVDKLLEENYLQGDLKKTLEAAQNL